MGLTWLGIILYVVGSFELIEGIVLAVAITLVTFHLFATVLVTVSTSIPDEPFQLAHGAGDADSTWM